MTTDSVCGFCHWNHTFDNSARADCIAACVAERLNNLGGKILAIEVLELAKALSGELFFGQAGRPLIIYGHVLAQYVAVVSARWFVWLGLHVTEDARFGRLVECNFYRHKSQIKGQIRWQLFAVANG